MAERLRRIERQLRSFGELHAGEVRQLAGRIGTDDGLEIARKLRTVAQLETDELALVTEELADIAREAAAEGAPPADPARSEKRERWLAEQERRENPGPVSRRELLFGKDEGDQPG